MAIPVKGNRLVILDPAGKFFTQTFGIFTSKEISIAIKEWLDHWRREYKEPFISPIFTDKIFKAFQSTEEFIAWALKQV